MNKVPEPMLHAYVDGELDADAVAQVEQAMRADPALVAQVAAERALRERLRQAFAPVLDEPLPERLLKAVNASASVTSTIDAGPSGTVVPMQAARGARNARSAWRWPEWTALAASLAFGVLVSPWLRPDGPQPLLEMSGAGMLAGAELADALDTRLSGDDTTAGAVAVGLSFRAQDGAYCRTFVLDPPRALAGLACREAGGWRVTALGESTPAGGELRLASSPLPPAILAEVDARSDGDVLDAVAERAARDAGWQ